MPEDWDAELASVEAALALARTRLALAETLASAVEVFLAWPRWAVAPVPVVAEMRRALDAYRAVPDERA